MAEKQWSWGCLSPKSTRLNLCTTSPQKNSASFLSPPHPTCSPARDPHLPTGARPPAAMTSFPTTPPPPEELMATTILQATEALSPEAEASTALIAVVITVVFLTLLSVVILIFFYLYKNKGSYVTYEPADGEPGAVVLMENDSAKGREKEEYFI
nr:small cell adhesion glycoprotein isoform X1 [Odocoileus virginianus texanus]